MPAASYSRADGSAAARCTGGSRSGRVGRAWAAARRWQRRSPQGIDVGPRAPRRRSSKEDNGEKVILTRVSTRRKLLQRSGLCLRGRTSPPLDQQYEHQGRQAHVEGLSTKVRLEAAGPRERHPWESISMVGERGPKGGTTRRIRGQGVEHTVRYRGQHEGGSRDGPLASGDVRQEREGGHAAEYQGKCYGMTEPSVPQEVER